MLYASHIAWLSATPEGDKKSRGESLHEHGEGSPFLQLPDVEDSYYLVKMWQHCGCVEMGNNGPMTLTWSEIRSWRLENELCLTNFERNCIREMSKAYVNEYYAAKDKSRQAPYLVSEESFDRVAVSNRVTNVLLSMKKSSQEDETRYTTE